MIRFGPPAEAREEAAAWANPEKAAGPRAAPAPAAKSAAPAEKKEKPLSRLEQLRLEAQKGKAAP